MLKDIDSVTKDIDSVTKDIDSVTKDIDSVTKDIDSVTKDIDSVTKDIDRMFGKIIKLDYIHYKETYKEDDINMNKFSINHIIKNIISDDIEIRDINLPFTIVKSDDVTKLENGNYNKINVIKKYLNELEYLEKIISDFYEYLILSISVKFKHKEEFEIFNDKINEVYDLIIEIRDLLVNTRKYVDEYSS